MKKATNYLGRPLKYELIDGKPATESNIYKTWIGIKNRTINSKQSSYQHYRKVIIGEMLCKEWLDFETFKDWAFANGYKYKLKSTYKNKTKKHRNLMQIDRIDGTKGYSPDNCRIVTTQANATNRLISKVNKTKYTGIYITVNKVNIYRGKICYKGKHHYSRSSDSVEECLNWRNNFIKKYNLPFKLQEFKGEHILEKCKMGVN